MLETSGPVPAFTDAVQARDVNRIAGLLSHDVRLSVPPLHYDRRGTQDVIAALVDLFRCFDELRYDVRSRYVAPGTVTDEAVFSGRQTAPFLGGEPGRHLATVPARVIVAHDAATITGVTLWPDLAALRASVGGSSRMIDLTRVGGAGVMVAALRATIPPARARLIIGNAREEQAPAPPVAVEVTPAGVGEAGPLAGRTVPRSPVPRQVRRRRAVLAGGAMALVSGALTLWVALSALDQSERSPGRGPAGVPAASTPAEPSGAGRTGAGAPGGAGTPGTRGGSSDLADAEPPRLTAGVNTLKFGSDVLFDTDSDRLRPEASAILDDVIAAARAQHRHGRVTVNGYTDDVGTQAYNLDLSRRRAATVAAYLKKGLSGAGMTFVWRGYGATHPTGDNTTDAGRGRNRRVTIAFPRAAATDLSPRRGAAAA